MERDPRVLKHVVRYLRREAGMSQATFAEKLYTTQPSISHWEQGHEAPPEDTLRRMAEVARKPWHLVQHLIRCLTAVQEAVDHSAAPGVAALDLAVLDNVLLAVRPYLVEEAWAPPAVDKTLREAREIWAALEPLPKEERRRRIETAPPGACRSWAALVKVVCEASARAAADSAERARELAEL